MGEMKGMLKDLIEAVADLRKPVAKNQEELATEESSGGSIQQESRLSGKKVKLPAFEGEDPVAWITRAEIYFDVQQTTD
jgi:ATP sulfurylase